MTTETRTAIVTGGARGIGRGCALALADEGFDIVLVDLLVPEMQRTVGEIEERGRRALMFEADVSRFALAQEIASDVLARWGRVDVLVNNAGKAAPQSLLEITEAEWDATIDVNLKSFFVWCRAVAPAMMDAEYGRIINMSSVNAFTGGITSAVSRFAYAAAKAGVLGLTRSLAKELGPNIAVNAICPGLIKTELGNSVVNLREAELIKFNALGRLGTPLDVAQLVLFLATVEPNYLTGQAFVIDGFQWHT
jgi:3-oxoacyl-[acyl-carrier protein] reductase